MKLIFLEFTFKKSLCFHCFLVVVILILSLLPINNMYAIKCLSVPNQDNLKVEWKLLPFRSEKYQKIKNKKKFIHEVYLRVAQYSSLKETKLKKVIKNHFSLILSQLEAFHKEVYELYGENFNFHFYLHQYEEALGVHIPLLNFNVNIQLVHHDTIDRDHPGGFGYTVQEPRAFHSEGELLSLYKISFDIRSRLNTILQLMGTQGWLSQPPKNIGSGVLFKYGSDLYRYISHPEKTKAYYRGDTRLMRKKLRKKVQNNGFWAWRSSREEIREYIGMSPVERFQWSLKHIISRKGGTDPIHVNGGRPSAFVGA